MTTTRHIIRAAIAAATLWCSPSWASEDVEPLECPQCGEWTLIQSNPLGLVGERLVVTQDKVSIPMCGEFRPDGEWPTQRTKEENGYTYRLSIALRGAGYASCASSGSTEAYFRANVEISVAYRRDGGYAEFVIVEPGSGRTVFTASGWNYERDNPCETGSGRGSLACTLVANAQLLRQLTQSALHANPNYRLGRVLMAAERACSDKGQDAGGSWPSVWREACKGELLQQKLEAFTAFHECRATTGRSCRVPDEKVGRPSEWP